MKYLMMVWLIVASFSSNASLNPVQVAIAYILVALTQGRVVQNGAIWALVGTWWGVFGMCYLMWCLCKVANYKK